MATIRERMVEEALTWVRTPYVDHAGIKNVGVDCAYFPIRVLQSVGIIPADFEPPNYSPQQWMHGTAADTTYLDTLNQFAKREIFNEWEIQPGDLALFKLKHSWTHGAIVIDWPHRLLHPVKEKGVIGSRSDEGMFNTRERRYFSFVE